MQYAAGNVSKQVVPGSQVRRLAGSSRCGRRTCEPANLRTFNQTRSGTSAACGGGAKLRHEYEMLRAVSRTFALSIEQLPRVLRDSITIAYLLLRVSDCL